MIRVRDCQKRDLPSTRKKCYLKKEKILVLGSSGMLGQEVARVLTEEKIPFSAFSKRANSKNYFDFQGQDAKELIRQLSLTDEAYVINCIGWIPQRASGDSGVDKANAWKLNVRLPAQLEEISGQMGLRVLQVATDCVFDGTVGNYLETDEHNAQDLYGTSKREGELLQPSAMRIRASIIGQDLNSNAGLFSWYKSQASDGFVTGYTNQIWNGVTTRALSKLFIGIIVNNAFRAGVQHWIPNNSVSKFTLLSHFKELVGKSGADVKPGESSNYVDRTLATKFPENSERYWRLAGYRMVPSVAELIGDLP